MPIPNVVFIYLNVNSLCQSQWEGHGSVMSIKIADVAEERECGVLWDVRGVSSGNRAMTLPIETGLTNSSLNLTLTKDDMDDVVQNGHIYSSCFCSSN